MKEEGRVLLIDDDTELCSMLQNYLGRHGWIVAARHSGEVGLRAALEGQYKIVLLDVMLQDLDGFGRQRQDALLIAFAAYQDLGVG